jgi:hypothetical protein
LQEESCGFWVQQSVVSGRRSRSSEFFVCGGVCLCACLFVCFFWRAGTDDHKEDEIENHVNFKPLSSSSAENITQERKKE